jgi:spermidine/putrescine transport system substrate-binding protein
MRSEEGAGGQQNGAEGPSWDQEVSRAQLLKVGAGSLGALAFGSLLAAPGAGAGLARLAATRGVSAVGTVHMLGWQGYDDIKARKVFTKAGGKLQTTYISSNDEVLTKLRGGQTGVYDLITISASYLPALVKAKLIEPLDYTKIPNAKGYMKPFNKPTWNTFAGQTWGAPIQWGDQPMVYRPDLMKKLGLSLPKSMLNLGDPQYKNRVAMWDDLFGHIIVTAKALGFYPPNKLTQAQLDKVVTAMRRIRQNSRVIAASLGDLSDILAKGDVAITTQSNEVVAMNVRAKGKPAKWYSGKEGSWAWCDQFCIPKDAPNPTGAYAYMDSILNPKMSAQMSMDLAEATPIAAAVKYLDATTKSIYDFSNITGYLAKFGFYSLPPLEKKGNITTYKDWTTAWEKIKS